MLNSTFIGFKSSYIKHNHSDFLAQIQAKVISLLFVLLLTALSSSTVYAAPPTLSNSEASSLIETDFNKYKITIPLGEYNVSSPHVSDNVLWSSKTRIMSPNFFKRLLLYKEAGLISITQREANIAKKTENKSIDIAPTNIGRQLAFQEDKIAIRMRLLEVKVDSIVKNESKQKGAFDYRLVMATYKNIASKDGKQAFEKITNDTLHDKCKLIALFKYDPFSSSWSLITYDMAPLNGDFNTNNVSRELREN